MGLPGRYSDLWLATCVVMLCCWGAWRTYAHVVQLERADTAVLGALTGGKSEYAVLMQEKCIGDFKLDIAHRSNFFMEGNLKLRLAFGRLKSDGQADFKAEFNPIGQFTSGKLQLALLGNQIEVSAENVNPIKLTAAFGTSDAQMKQEFELPGPLLLVKDSDTRYRLEHKEQRAAGALAALPFLRSALGESKLQVVAASDAAAAGCRGEGERFDIEPLYKGFGLKLQHIEPYFFDLTPGER